MKITHGPFERYSVCRECDRVHHQHFGRVLLCRGCGSTKIENDVIGRYVTTTTGWLCKTTTSVFERKVPLTLEQVEERYGLTKAELFFKRGDRVRVKAPDNSLLKYEGWTEATGTVCRIRNGKIRVEVDNTGSQDSEGHNAYSDFAFEEVSLLEEKK